MPHKKINGLILKFGIGNPAGFYIRNQEFHKRLVEYPLLLDKIKMLVQELEMSKRNEIWYQEQQERLLQTINQRNYIEAKEKKLD